MRSIADIQRQLPTTPESGLSSAAAVESRARFGANHLTPLPSEPLWRKFLEKFDEPIIKILLAAALLSMLVELFKLQAFVAGIALGVLAAGLATAFFLNAGKAIPTLLFASAMVLFVVGLAVDYQHPLVEGLAVMIAVMLATGVAFVSEYKSDREFEVLNAQKESLQTKVLRDGRVHQIALEEIVVGDVVRLEMGDEIPADGRVLQATEFMVDQSLMTGESEAVRKLVLPADDTAEGPDQPGCLYRGTQIVDGVGAMLVADVGDATALGQIARRLSAEYEGESKEGETEEERVKRKLTMSKALTPLQLKLGKLADLISRVGYAAATLIFLALLVRGLWAGEVRWPQAGEEAGPVLLDSAGYLLSYFVYMVIIIVVAVPEGLPMSVTISLALAMQKMTRANCLVRQLVACETIGSATVICSDKTGTLTQNKMQVVRLAWVGRVLERGNADWSGPEAHAPWPRAGTPLDWLAVNAVVNSTANLEEKDGKLVTIGNATEAALLLWLRESGIDYLKLRRQFPELYQVHFSSDRKRMTTVIRYGDRLAVLVKGASEWVLAHATRYQTSDGSAADWSPAARAEIEHGISDAASQAMRTLAFGYALLPPDTPDDEDALHERRESLERNLVFAGFVAIRDPLRAEVKAAVAECRAAGIEVKMITGDNVETARAIAFDLGLIETRSAAINTPDAEILTSDAYNALTDEDMSRRLPGLRVLARARPLDKYRMVSLLQQQNHVVAVTGDGTNDAPALKKADVGLAMGIAGTEVSKEASKIVLLDDSFATIVKAVHWGRSLYENIQRFIQFQLTINVSALTIAFLGPFFGVRPPFTVLQLLWINVIMDTFAAIALCSEPPRPGLMNLAPKRRDENIVTRSMLTTILSTAAFFVVVMLGLLVGMRYGGWFADAVADDLTLRQATIFFSVYVFFQVWNQINCRSLTLRVSGFHRVWRNPTFLAIAGTTALGQILIVTLGGAIFKVQPLRVVEWLCIIAGTASVLVFAEAVRFLRRETQR